MKLKKIASLMLAGIMAVSMLAGCKDAASSDATDPTVPVTPVTGTAAIVNDELENNEDKIVYTDNQALEDLLTSYFTENKIEKAEWSAAGKYALAINHVGDYYDLTEKVQDLLDAKNMNYVLNDFSGKLGEDGTWFYVYAINSKYADMDAALRMVGEAQDKITLKSENDGDSISGTGATGKDGKTHNLSYTGSIAAIEAKSAGETESVYIIVAAITQSSAKK